MSSDASPSFSQIDAHKIWYFSPEMSLPVAVYFRGLVDHFSTLGAIVGPDDWYVSQIETYKDKKGLRHELLMATIHRTPRAPRQNEQHSSDSHPGEISTEARQAQPDDTPGPQIGFLIIERRMDRAQNKQNASQTDAANPSEQSHSNANDGDSSSLSDSLKESTRLKKYTVQFSAGKNRALNEVRHKLKKDGLNESELLGRMNLPNPPTLPAEDDSDTVFNELSAKALSQGGSAAPTSPSSLSSHFVSVPALLCLAHTVSRFERSYSITEFNCYWYSAMIFYSLRQYTRADIILHGSEKITIGPEDSSDVIKKKFNQAKLESGRFGFFDIVAPPNKEKIDLILSRWECDRAEMDNECCERRLAWIEMIERDRRKAREAEAARDQALKDKAKLEEETKRMEEMLNRALEFVAAHGGNPDEFKGQNNQS